MRKVRKTNIINPIKEKVNNILSKFKKQKPKNRSKSTTKERNKRAWWKKVITILLILSICAILAFTVFIGYIVISAPEFDDKALEVKEQTVIYDVDGEVITTLGVEKRENATYEELPQVLIDAIIATEDSRFFQHNGVDLFRFIKATALQLIGRDEAGGASTLSMQTVKNMLTKKDSIESSKGFKNKVKKVIRKFQDVYLAVFKLEKQYSKEQILEIYVNDNFLGGGYYGVKEASKYYFGKDVSELTLPEAAMLAGLFQLPDGNNPYKNIEGATKRRNLVLEYMYNHNYITKEERDIAKSIKIEDLLVGSGDKNSPYQGYIDMVIDEVIEKTGNNPSTTPMKIYTTMERNIQDGLNEIFSGDGWYWKDEYVQGGVAIVNAENGTISAIGSGRNRNGERLFNYATGAKRQPGSTAKPLFDYGPGIEYNNFSSYQLFMDEPWQYTDGPSVNNWDGSYYGLITARYALQVSRNIPALKAFQQVGAKNSQKFVYSLGLDVSYNSSSENYRVFPSGIDNTINEAYSIGGAAEGFTPLTMAGAYAAFANGGYYTTPHAVEKIIYREDGEEIELKYDKERVMKDSTAYIMNNILESAVNSGFNGGARVSGSHVAAKTGTSNFNDATMEKYNLPYWAVNDLWTVAYTSKYSVAVWYGYDEVTENTYNTDGSPKDALTAAVMKYIPKDTTGWTMPSSVVAVEVEKESWPAKLPSEYTPSDMRLTEYFVRGTQPTEVSDRYQKLPDVKNLKQEKNNNSITLTWEFTTPTNLTEDYLKKVFTNSVYGKSGESALKSRLEYNTNTLGDLGFGIYKQNTDGTLSLLEFVKDNTYTYMGYGNTELVVKAEHEKFKSNASNGIKVTANLGELNASDLTVSLKGNNNVTANAKSYTDEGIKSITYGALDITNTATLKYQIIATGTTPKTLENTYNSANEFETYVNTLPAGTYTITYTVTYLGISTTKTRNLTIK